MKRQTTPGYATMNILSLILLAAPIVLACVVLYRCFPHTQFRMDSLLGFLRPRAEKAGAEQETSEPDDAQDMGDGLLHEEVGRVRRLAAELNKGRLDIEWAERSLREKSRRLDMLIAKAEQALDRASGAQDDDYSKAGMLLELGLPADEITKRLDLTSGELELIERLRGYGSVASTRKKAPHREDTSHFKPGAHARGESHAV